MLRRAPHYHVSVSTPERLLMLHEVHGTYLGALAEARRLAVEAKPAAGLIERVDGQRLEGYLVNDAAGEMVATVAISAPCRGHPAWEVSARMA